MSSTSDTPPPSGEGAGKTGKNPVDRFNDGPVHVSIFENAGPHGPFRVASFQIRYRAKGKSEWQTGHSYGSADLQHLESAAREARQRIDNWKSQNTSAGQSTAPKP